MRRLRRRIAALVPWIYRQFKQKNAKTGMKQQSCSFGVGQEPLPGREDIDGQVAFADGLLMVQGEYP